MKKRRLYSLICLLLIFVGIGILSIPKIKITVSNIYAWHYRNDNPGINNLDQYEDMTVDADAWYSKYNVIAHSGGIDTYTYTDSLEAWNQSYANGTRIFDADLSFTSDNYVVLRHEWSDDLGQDNISENNIPDHETFMNTKIYGKYTPMDIESMLDFMVDHDDLYVACDFKDGTEIISALVESVQTYGCEEVLDRVIISFYTYDDYYRVKEIYPFENYAIRQYNNNYYEMAEFCLRENVPVVMVYTSRLEDNDNISVLTDKGIQVWGAVVNDLSKYSSWNLNGIVSDWISENDYKIN